MFLLRNHLILQIILLLLPYFEIVLQQCYYFVYIRYIFPKHVLLDFVHKSLCFYIFFQIANQLFLTDFLLSYTLLPTTNSSRGELPSSNAAFILLIIFIHQIYKIHFRKIFNTIYTFRINFSNFNHFIF